MFETSQPGMKKGDSPALPDAVVLADRCRAAPLSHTPNTPIVTGPSPRPTPPYTSNAPEQGRHRSADLSVEVDAYLDAEREKHPDPTPTEARVWQYLCTHAFGRANARSGADLAAKFGVTKRTIQVCVERLRTLRGRLIASSTKHDGGYFIPEFPEEARRYLAESRARAAVQHAGVTQQEAAYSEVFEPYQLDLPIAAG